MKTKYYSLKNILQKNATYSIIFGERSNGKTYAVLHYILEKYVNQHEQGAIIRRWQDDFIGKRGQVMFDGLVSSGAVAKITNGEWTSVFYYASKWYLCKYDEEHKRIVDETPFAYGFSITSMEHDKSTAYPNVTTICFDEFLTRKAYLPDEFVLFMNVCSTIIRDRNNVKIFMLGNTVNKYCPYFSEMGLKHVKDMKQGTIDVYTYGDSTLTVAVEYCSSNNKDGKASDSYFAFDNPKLNMITGGTWELDIYPHCPTKFKPKDIVFIFFIQFNDELLQCELVYVDESSFIYIHQKTTPLRDSNYDLIFTSEYDHRFNIRRKITKPITNIEKRIYNYFVSDKVFYQDNEVGEIVRNYLIWCKGV